MEELKRGTQIIYIPDHAEGDVAHPHCEEGFVTSVDAERGVAWCRYWRSGEMQLRTTTCSEMTPISNLRIEDTFPQEVIERTLEDLSPAPCNGCKRDCRTAFPACMSTHNEETP